jgi:hypothetical protein
VKDPAWLTGKRNRGWRPGKKATYSTLREAKMKLVVIESPYAGNIKENIAYAKRCVLDCLRRGEAPYASHLFFTQEGILDEKNPEERLLGIEAGLAWGANAYTVAVYLDLGISGGMRHGMQFYTKVGIVVEPRRLDTEVTYEDCKAVQEASEDAGFSTRSVLALSSLDDEPISVTEEPCSSCGGDGLSRSTPHECRVCSGTGVVEQ